MDYYFFKQARLYNIIFSEPLRAHQLDENQLSIIRQKNIRLRIAGWFPLGSETSEGMYAVF